MDANGLRFWMLADADQWHMPVDPEHGQQTQYDRARRSLQLDSVRKIPPLPESDESLERAQNLLDRVPQTRDEYGTRAYWDGTRSLVMATGALESTLPIFAPPIPGAPTDLAMGYDGVLYLAADGRVVMHDLRGRWNTVVLQHVAVDAWRLAADPAGGVWVLDPGNHRLARVLGRPFPKRPPRSYTANTFRPCSENPNPPRLISMLDMVWPETVRPVAIACSPNGRVAVLCWRAGGDAFVRLLTPDALSGKIGTNDVDLSGARHPYSLAWVTEDRVAVMLVDMPGEAPTFSIDGRTSAAQAVGDYYPLRDHAQGPFLHGLTLPPHYPTAAGSRPIHHLSLPTYAPTGEAANATVLDSGDPQTIWHRLYLEARFPPNCGALVYLAAGDDARAPLHSSGDWYEHRFGQMFVNGAGSANGDKNDSETGVAHGGLAPQGVWISEPSEIPYHPGLTVCTAEPNRAGLFTVLIQRAGRRVRTLRGRYLHIRICLYGDGRTTPEIWALRAYAPRFSYLEHYLPALYKESLFAPDADEPVSANRPASRADFLDRFLNNFESVLTPLEDRIAGSYLLTDPRSAPEEALEWLGSWIGVGYDPAYPPDRRRQLLQSAPALFRQRGTLTGLELALNTATGGAVDGGEIVIVEDWRLRRVFATILGADLADEDDPLLGGIVASGNSFVGDTLFLGDENEREFLALFTPDAVNNKADEAIIRAFFDELAYRVTVLVHQEAAPQELGLIRRVIELETPAHVVTKVVTASRPFLVGMASLVGVDSYLADEAEPTAVRVGVSQVGLRDLLQRPASLDPRIEGGPFWSEALGVQRPVARLPERITAEVGESFILDGSASSAATGRAITRYIWKRID